MEGSTSAILRVKWLLFGLQLISASSEGEIIIWNVPKGIKLCSYESHKGRIWAMDILDDEKYFRIISGDNESTLFLWEDDTENLFKNEIQ